MNPTPHAPYPVPRAPCLMPRAPAPRAPCPVPHAPCPVPHAPCDFMFRTLGDRIFQKYKDLCVANNVHFVERSGDAIWQKFLGVKASCRKMHAIWQQVHTPLKSGWTETDYKVSANEV